MEYIKTHKNNPYNEVPTVFGLKRGPQDELSNNSKRRRMNNNNNYSIGNRLPQRNHKDRRARKMEKLNQRTSKANSKCTDTIIQWNACGLKNKWAEIQLLSVQYRPKIIALQETLFDTKKYFIKLDSNRYRWHILPGPNPSKNGVADRKSVV